MADGKREERDSRPCLIGAAPDLNLGQKIAEYFVVQILV